MADNNPGWLSVKKREKKGESKPPEKEEEQEKEQEKEKVLKTGYQVVKTGYQHQPGEVRKKEGGGEKTGGTEEITEVAEGGEANGEFETIELPPWEIVTGEQMSPFYFKFQFRNVEYSSGRNKTLLCYRVETPEGATDPLQGYMEDEHATAHVEVAFFRRVLPHFDSSQEYEVRWT
ncbi:probable C-_U-editing enzyme APOBEC-2 isoform X2 [Salmo trutta]|uniref:probable C->U-editing enzyme APOBEC-2 isoform X2 n=1 Tax=Salmo trutta TaxID=8032 RepID=UPI0011300737|nr:probable C->U-editing enzyme APOBEC-2 isoform X2 [Salmo trutta]